MIRVISQEIRKKLEILDWYVNRQDDLTEFCFHQYSCTQRGYFPRFSVSLRLALFVSSSASSMACDTCSACECGASAGCGRSTPQLVGDKSPALRCYGSVRASCSTSEPFFQLT